VFIRSSFDPPEPAGDGVVRTEADGTNPRLLAAGGQSPSWSPDGRRIVLQRNGNEIVVMRADGSHQRSLGTHGSSLSWTSWSPDGRRVVFAGATTDSDIYSVRANGTDLRNLTNTPDEFEDRPVYAPDGTRGVFEMDAFRPTSFGHVPFVMSSAGGPATQLLPAAGIYWDQPDWQPR
jgi:TolB protein